MREGYDCILHTIIRVVDAAALIKRMIFEVPSVVIRPQHALCRSVASLLPFFNSRSPSALWLSDEGVTILYSYHHTYHYQNYPFDCETSDGDFMCSIRWIIPMDCSGNR